MEKRIIHRTRKDKDTVKAKVGKTTKVRTSFPLNVVREFSTNEQSLAIYTQMLLQWLWIRFREPSTGKVFEIQHFPCRWLLRRIPFLRGWQRRTTLHAHHRAAFPPCTIRRRL